MDGISLNKISGADDLSGDPVAVPVEGPELGEFDQLGVAIGETHVDRAGQGLAAGVGNGIVGRRPAVAQNRATAHSIPHHPIWPWLTGVKVAGRTIGFEGKGKDIILIAHEWSLRGLQN